MITSSGIARDGDPSQGACHHLPTEFRIDRARAMGRIGSPG
jgi:hypothetical protein